MRYMLSSIMVKNLGCFDDYPYEIEFNKLNLIVGPNNSGKSTIFKGLNLLRTFGFSNLAWETTFYHLQNNKEAVYDHDLTRTIEISTSYKLGSDIYDAELGIRNNAITRNSFLKNASAVGGGMVNNLDFQNIAQKIWYFSPNRTLIPHRVQVGSQYRHPIQSLSPDGNDVIQYLLERWTDQDPNWSKAQEWFKAIDPQMNLLKTPVVGNVAAVETERNDGAKTTSVNLSLQGSGLQNVATIIAGIIFSKKGDTIIIEEPENYLHRESVEKLVDLINFAVNELGKQIIITTHSWNIIGTYSEDLAKDVSRRTRIHEPAKSEHFRLIEFGRELREQKIQEYTLPDKKHEDVIEHFQAY